jgi:hypothetical protein
MGILWTILIDSPGVIATHSPRLKRPASFILTTLLGAGAFGPHISGKQ